MQVRLVDADGSQAGVVSLAEAQAAARRAGVDLVEVAGAASPPVCRVMDYGKFKYRESKRVHGARAKQKQVEVKEVKFRITIGDADYGVKLRNIRRFLEEGNRVKVTLWFRGRQIVHRRLGERLLERVVADVEDLASVEIAAKLEGKRMTMVLGRTTSSSRRKEAKAAVAKESKESKEPKESEAAEKPESKTTESVDVAGNLTQPAAG